jgi:tetratricopeptide (TPR) repeat protein
MLLETYGQESRDVAKIKCRLGFVKIQMENLEDGINLIKQSLATLIASGLEKDTSLATAYMNISTGYRLQENYTEALESIEKAIEIFHDNRGEFHVDTAEAYVEYAQVFLAMENLVSAKEYFQKAYDIRLAKLGDNHPDTFDAKRFLDEQN